MEMATVTITPAAMLDEAAARLRVKRNALDTLTRELETATHEAESLRLLREKFLIPASAGDQAALAHVQELEQRQIAVGRKHVTISRQIGEARAAVRAREISDEALRLAHNVQALYRQACRAEHDLS